MKIFFWALIALFCALQMLARVLEPFSVSNTQYCDFLNACAREGDPFHLWNPLMQDHWWGGIVRVEAKSSCYTYRVKPGYEKKPATCVTWESAARYCNWLSFGRPDTGRAELGTTEADDKCGVYDTRAFGSDAFVRSPMQVKRQSDQAYYLPTAEEWRAAAFCGGDTGLVNIYDGHWAVPSPHLLDVDQGVTNRMGFVNMLGNVGEWVETRRGNFFLALGGSLIRGPYSTQPGFSEGDESNRAISSFGFRVAHAVDPKVLEVGVGIGRSELDFARQRKTTTNVWCRVGNEGNDRDPVYKVGRVCYTFEMTKYPVTNAEWCEFMNAVGVARAVELGLYNPDMATGVCGGIEVVDGGCRKEDSTTTTTTIFKPKPGWARRPVVYIGYRDAMRYCNWLQTGDTERGAYDVSTPNARRNAGARYFIPTDDEWCKAAYYDPTRLGNRKYWDYPCRTSDPPPNDPKLPHACNYLRDGVYLGEKGPFYLAEVDAYPTSDTYYGCCQMAGNVWEWVEPAGTDKLNLRGSSFGYTEFGMGIWNRDEAGFDDELNVFGLRLARAVKNPKIVEPGIGTLLQEYIMDMSSKRLVLWFEIAFLMIVALGFICGKKK